MSVVIQRPLRGSRISSFYPIKTLPSLSSLDSAFQLQEYISLLIRLDVHDVDTIVSVPGKNDADDKEKNRVEVDEACWIYEQLRRLAQDLSHPLITMLQTECSRSTCPEMKAGEWLYLCVAHGNDGAMEQCCAIDYILHTLDSATALLNSPRAFPSRLQIPAPSHRHFPSLARRLGRIFAHAYFHHREAFEQAEAESSLYARFLALTSKFDLVPPEFLVIPPRLQPDAELVEVQPPRLLAASVGREPYEHASEDAGKSGSPPGLGSGGGSGSGSESPRKYGRSRTDTMVFSEAYNSGVLEDLAKSEKEDADAAAGLADANVQLDEPHNVNVLDEPVLPADESDPPFSDEPIEAEASEAEADITSAAAVEPVLHVVTPSSSTIPQEMKENLQVHIDPEVPNVLELAPTATEENVTETAPTAEAAVDATQLPAVDASATASKVESDPQDTTLEVVEARSEAPEPAPSEDTEPSDPPVSAPTTSEESPAAVETPDEPEKSEHAHPEGPTADEGEKDEQEPLLVPIPEQKEASPVAAASETPENASQPPA